MRRQVSQLDELRGRHRLESQVFVGHLLQTSRLVQQRPFGAQQATPGAGCLRLVHHARNVAVEQHGAVLFRIQVQAGAAGGGKAEAGEGTYHGLAASS
jgi:hypothetical protein